MAGPDDAQLRNGDLKVGEDFQQEGFEFFIGAIDFIDEQHGGSRTRMAQSGQQWARKEKLVAEDALFQPCAGGGILFGNADVQDLPCVIPFVKGAVRVEPLISLQPYQRGVEQACKHLGDFSLAYPRLAFQQERLAQIVGELEAEGEGTAREIGFAG